MTMTFTRSLLATAVIVGLTACGSGGGNGMNNNTTSQVTGKTGAMYTVSLTNDNKIGTVTKTPLNSSDINSLNLDSASTQRINEAMNKISEEFKSKTGLDVVTGAAIVSNGENFHIIYNGNPTETMPVQGSIHYKGSAVLGGWSADAPLSIEKGTSQFDVNFADNTLTGTLNVPNFSLVSISASVSGNGFSGRATSPDAPDGAVVEGKFYGKDVLSLSGMLKTNTFTDNFGGAGIFSAIDETKITQ